MKVYKKITELVGGTPLLEIENIEKGGPIGIADHYITNNADEKTFLNEINEYIESVK